MENKLVIMGIAGSLRKESYNLQLIKLYKSMLPDIAEMVIFDLNLLPIYNTDVEDTGFPESVIVFKETARLADGIVISTPEYNYSISGILKNALDWISRPPNTIPVEGKPGVVMSASTSKFGGARAQQHLRQILSALGVHLMPQPELFLPQAHKVFFEKEPLELKVLSYVEKFVGISFDFIKNYASNKRT